MTTSFLWFALAFGASPSSGLSSEDFDEFFTEFARTKKECGPTVVCYCLGRLGQEISLEEAKRRVNIDENGASLLDLLDLLHDYGVPARVLHAQTLDFRLLPCPCIVVIGERHCVALERVEPSGKEATIFEPARLELITLPIEELTRQASGEVIVFSDPGLELPVFVAWTVCYLTLFLFACLGAVWIGSWLNSRQWKKEAQTLKRAWIWH